MTARPPSVTCCSWPWTRVIPRARPESSAVAKLPRVATTARLDQLQLPVEVRLARRRLRRERVAVAGRPALEHRREVRVVEREPDGGRGAARAARRRARRTGSPSRSSWKPGASPTSTRSASGFPSPNTTCVRPSASGQRTHSAASAATASRLEARSAASTPNTLRPRSATLHLTHAAPVLLDRADVEPGGVCGDLVRVPAVRARGVRHHLDRRRLPVPGLRARGAPLRRHRCDRPVRGQRRPDRRAPLHAGVAARRPRGRRADDRGQLVVGPALGRLRARGVHRLVPRRDRLPGADREADRGRRARDGRGAAAHPQGLRGAPGRPAVPLRDRLRDDGEAHGRRRRDRARRRGDPRRGDARSSCAMSSGRSRRPAR